MDPPMLITLKALNAPVPCMSGQAGTFTGPGPSLINMARTATDDVEVRGQTIEKGRQLLLVYASANRDERVFDEPDRFDVGRDPNPHVSFGFGGHFCLGASLARLEIRVLYEELAQRAPKIKQIGDAERLRSNFINGIKHLPVHIG